MTKRDDLLQDIFSTMDTQQRAMHSTFQHHFSKLDLPPAQLKLLTALAHCSRCSLKPLAEKLYLTPGALSQLVEPLEKASLVDRQHDDKDRRIVYVSLTKAGEKKLVAVKKMRQTFFKKALGALDDAELEMFSRIQQKMFHYFEEQNSPNKSKESDK